MTEERMNQVAYNDIASEHESFWEKNVVMLRKAIQHIDDKEETLWNAIMPLLPKEKPTTDNGAELKGLYAIIALRKYIINHLGGFEDLQKRKFKATEEWEFCRKANGMDLGYTVDGFKYSLSDTMLKMVWEEDTRFGSYEILENIKPEDLCAIPEDCKKKTPYKYVNSVDHLFTNLIWLVVSGIEGGDAFNKADTPGLYYSFADVFGYCVTLRSLLSEPYSKMLDSAAEEAEKAKKPKKPRRQKRHR